MSKKFGNLNFSRMSLKSEVACWAWWVEPLAGSGIVMQAIFWCLCWLLLHGVGQALDSMLRSCSLPPVHQCSMPVTQLGCIMMDVQLKVLTSSSTQTLLERVWRKLALISSFLC